MPCSAIKFRLGGPSLVGLALICSACGQDAVAPDNALELDTGDGPKLDAGDVSTGDASDAPNGTDLTPDAPILDSGTELPEDRPIDSFVDDSQETGAGLALTIEGRARLVYKPAQEVQAGRGHGQNVESASGRLGRVCQKIFCTPKALLSLE